MAERRNDSMAEYLRPHTCKMCGAEFIGGNRALYCLECRKKRQREADRLCYEKRKEHEKLATEEAPEEKPANTGKKKKCPNTKQCRGCTYWRRITSNPGATYCCHHLLWTGKCRKRDGDRCLSRTTKAVKPNTSPWPAYQTGDSVYAGYKCK